MGKLGLGINWNNFWLEILGLLIKVMRLFIILFKLCGGILVVIFIVILEELFSNKNGSFVGKILGFCWELLKLFVKLIIVLLIWVSKFLWLINVKWFFV